MQKVTFVIAIGLVSANPAVAQASESPYWQMVWQDEFNGHQLDTRKWQAANNCWGGGNQERQCYTPRTENVTVEAGLLQLIARQETHTGPALPRDMVSSDTPQNTTLPYTSGRIRSKGRGDWLYGRFDIRAKLPSGQGVWPAIWMLPTDNSYGGWAASGEIDIMEAVNLGTPSDANDNGKDKPETRVHGTLHFGAAWPDNVHAGAPYRLPDNASPADGFHTYSVEWQAGEIRWYVDGVHYATQTSTHWYTQPTDDAKQALGPHAPFDQRFHMVLNLAIGGGWPEASNAGGVDETGFPKTLLIDYVRVFQCSSGNTEDCATRDPAARLVTDIVNPHDKAD